MFSPFSWALSLMFLVEMLSKHVVVVGLVPADVIANVVADCCC